MLDAMRCASFVLAIGLFLTAAGVGAQTHYPAKSAQANAAAITIYSSLDERISKPLITAFQDRHPDIAINYLEAQTLEIYERVIRETDEKGATADLTISSAMDLQVKLANDGYARAVTIDGDTQWPAWANWRNSAFAFTFEPAVIIYHKPSFTGDVRPPMSHGELIAFLNVNRDAFFGRIGTYDIERAGLGFLFFARDREHYRDIWELVGAMGRTGVKLYSESAAILERVGDGRFALGYNILGSYAANWAQHNKDIGIILPADYTVVMSRIALVPQAAAAPQLGTLFLSFLMSREGQRVMAQEARMPALHPDVSGENTASSMAAVHGDRLRPVPVSLGLLVYLDQVKRARLIRQWNEALSRR